MSGAQNGQVAEAVEALSLNADEAVVTGVEVTATQDDVVDPWTVTSSSDSGIDYDKLISKFAYFQFF